MLCHQLRLTAWECTGISGKEWSNVNKSWWNEYMVETLFSKCSIFYWVLDVHVKCKISKMCSIQYIPRNMHTVFALLCFVVVIHWLIFPISIRLTSLALWQSNDCPSASKATLMNMDKYFRWIHYERLHNHYKAKHNKTVCIFLGIYCMPVQCEGRVDYACLCVAHTAAAS